MLLTDEMFEIGKNSKGICTILDEDYVLVSKCMPVTDDGLDRYIENMTMAKLSGINLATILDYRLIDGTTCCYGDKDICYSKGVFLEERAKGVSNDKKFYWLSLGGQYDFEEVTTNYLKKSLNYIEELEKRASVSIEFYEKFVEDCLHLGCFGLQIDPKPLNFFFDKSIGYTIIDVVQSQEIYSWLPDGFAECFFEIVFGFGRTSLFVDLVNMSFLPYEYYERLYNAAKKLEAMIVKVLRKYGVLEDIIRVAVARNANKYMYDMPFVESGELKKLVEDTFNDLHNDSDKDDKLAMNRFLKFGL